MEKKNRYLTIQKIIMCILFFAVFGVMMAIGTPNDLEIDKSLFNYSNPFANFMEDYGMLPVYSVQLLAFCVLVAAYHKVDEVLDVLQAFLPFVEKLRAKKPFKAVIFIIHHIIYALFLYGAFMGCDELLNYVLCTADGGNIQDIIVAAGAPKFVGVIVWTIVRIAIELAAILLLRKIDTEHLKMLEVMAVAGLLLYHGSDVINMIKSHFHRVRFREMVAYSHGLIDANGISCRGDADMPRDWIKDSMFFAYTPWYKIGEEFVLFSDSNSFPSGHTAAAAFSMLLPALAAKMKNGVKLFIPAFILGFGYTVAVGITRLVMGAHYLTDVAAGAMIMFAMIIVVVCVMNSIERIFDKRIHKLNRRREREVKIAELSKKEEKE